MPFTPVTLCLHIFIFHFQGNYGMDTLSISAYFYFVLYKMNQKAQMQKQTRKTTSMCPKKALKNLCTFSPVCSSSMKGLGPARSVFQNYILSHSCLASSPPGWCVLFKKKTTQIQILSEGVEQHERPETIASNVRGHSKEGEFWGCRI